MKNLRMPVKVFPLKIRTIQMDNGSAFTCKCIRDTEERLFDTELRSLEITHRLIPSRTPQHYGKVERSHRNDQRCMNDWEIFRSVEELNGKLTEHLMMSNNKPMRTLGNIRRRCRPREWLHSSGGRRIWRASSPPPLIFGTA